MTFEYIHLMIIPRIIRNNTLANIELNIKTRDAMLLVNWVY